MSNRHGKVNRKPTVEQFMRAEVTRVKTRFPGMNVTIVARYPPDPDAEIVFSDDNIDGLIHTLQRRRDAVVASQASAEPQA